MVNELVVITLFCFGYVFVIYNNLNRINQQVRVKWYDVEIVLKQRYAELFKLLNLCKEHMQYEEKLLNDVQSARVQAIKEIHIYYIGSLNCNEKILQNKLIRLYALAEQYPLLTTNNNFQQLKSKLLALDTEIIMRCGIYNKGVYAHNTCVTKFPHKILALLFNFCKFEVLEL